MFARYDRNDILGEDPFGKPYIDYSKLSAKNPECRVHLYNIERMTLNKNDKVGVYDYAQYLNNTKILGVSNP